MGRKIEALREEALRLSEKERVELAAALLESLEPAADEDVESAWRDEVRRRVAALESGSAQTVSWAEVRDRLWARLHASS